MKKYLKTTRLCPHCGRRHLRRFTAAFKRLLEREYCEATKRLK